MNKFLLSILGFGAVFTSFSQVSITTGGSSADISGTTVNVAVDASQDINSIIFHVKNESGSLADLKIRRVLLGTLPQGGQQSWMDQVCWGVVGGFGTCYDCSGNTWTSPSEEIDNGADGELKPQIMPHAVEGSVKIRYYVMNGENFVDSVDVQWSSLSASVKENNEITMSVYPNPVASMLTIAANNFDGSYTIKITDVLGKVILEEKASGTEKIDVSDFKNGVYLVSVYSGGKALTTRRIVVRH